jgi:hypothetical protein
MVKVEWTTLIEEGSCDRAKESDKRKPSTSDPSNSSESCGTILIRELPQSQVIINNSEHTIMKQLKKK